MKRNRLILIGGGCLLLLAALTAFFYTKTYLAWNVPLYGVSMAAIFLEGAAMFALLSMAKEKPKNKVLLSALAGGAGAAGSVFAVSFIVNVLIYREQGNRQAAAATAGLGFLIALYGALRLNKLTGGQSVWKPVAGVLLSVCVLLGGLLPLGDSIGAFFFDRGIFTQANPAGSSAYAEIKPQLRDDADLYIAPDGDDENDGSFAHPLASIEKARDLVRAMDKTGRTGIVVALRAGDYAVSRIAFTAEDSGTQSCPITYCAYGDGEVVINGGKALQPADFSAVTDESVLARLPDDAAKNVVCTDLAALGLTVNDWGKLYAVGGYGSAARYDGDTTGPVPCVLYFNGTPMTTARYPDSGTLKVKTVIREGEGKESSTSNHQQRADWETLRNPETTIFTVDQAVADRINGYASLENVWLWTALMYNWADATSPLKSFEYETKAVEPAYVSLYGAVPGSEYYIFNVIEELDCPGEWYLDRESGKLYLWPPESLADAELMLSLSTENLITVTDGAFLRFEGLSIGGTRADGMAIKGSDIEVTNCNISCVSGAGIRVDGSRNTVSDCVLSHIGATGVDVAGGDRATLTPGENRVENCLIHDFSEVAVTAGVGVNLSGVGNVCAHNELHHSPQQAIVYGGNDMLIEYNLMHDVALHSDDCSAVYAGRRWDCCGSVVRYNVMYDLGDDAHCPNGIYWDDGMSGQTAYGNLIVNCKQYGFHLGGGRDLNVYGNILINCKTPISYDDRARDGVLHADSWFEHSREGSDMQQNLEAMPWQSARWLQAYPFTAEWSLDYSDTENPNFIPNPANSIISGNLIVHYAGQLGNIAQSVERFSDLSGNAIYRLSAMKKLFADPENGDYTLRDDAPVFDVIPDFAPLPLDQVGRKS
ncbi:MAG: right-handed parallel beta-helix repeat-containing protein [Clostridia bacterium]|nr:right-handed parallel beta-helix repeat-containing protein [Clostridia bacterium]